MSKELLREARLTGLENDIDWIKGSLTRLEARPHVCIQEAPIAGLQTWKKITGGVASVFAALLIALCVFFITTCQQQSHAAGVNETRLDNHSERIITLERNLREMDKARQADTAKILEAIRENHQSPSL